MDKSIFLFGAPCSGKGLLTLFATKRYGSHVDVVATGDLCRNRCQTDEEFRQRFAEIMRRRALVSDEEMYGLVMWRLGQITAPVVCFDGFGRTDRQIIWAQTQEPALLGPASLAIVLHAEREVCRERLHHRMKHQPNGLRDDDQEDKFEAGYTTFQDNWLAVLRALNKTGAQVEHVDANGSLENKVIPAALSLMAPFIYPREALGKLPTRPAYAMAGSLV